MITIVSCSHYPDDERIYHKEIKTLAKKKYDINYFTLSESQENLSDKSITSTANFTVAPESISPYLVKIECFCFTEQILDPGESKIFTMLFFLDPSLDLDENLKDLKELVFTYEFSEYKS